MFRIHLSAEEQRVVEQQYKASTDRRLRDRCQAVLMAHRGRKRRAIAEDLGMHRTTVKKWLDQYRARGVAGLEVRRAPGYRNVFPRRWPRRLLTGSRAGPKEVG